MKYVSVLLCLVLLIGTAIFLPSATDNQIIAGPDDGENEEIENVEDLIGMLYCINGSNYSLSTTTPEATEIKANESLAKSLISLSVSSEENNPTTLSNDDDDDDDYDDDDDDDDDDDYEITEYDFDSYTITEYCYLSSSSGRSSSSMNRELEIFVCDELTYYHSVGQSSSTVAPRNDSSDEDKKTQYTSVDFDLEIFIDSDEGDYFIKVNSWYMSAEESVTFSNEIMGKWLDIQDPGLGSALSSVNSSNLSAISTLSSSINQAYRDDELRKNSKFQTLSKSDFGDVFAENYDRFNITIDITDSESPSISLITAVSGTNIDNSSYAVNLEAIYTFKNIDNTTVSMDKHADIFEIEEDDVEDYIIFD